MQDTDNRRILADFQERFGKKKARTLLEISKGRAFVAAMSTPVGQEILAEAQERWSLLLLKIVNQTNNEAERLMFLALDELITVWASKIARYFKLETDLEAVSLSE